MRNLKRFLTGVCMAALLTTMAGPVKIMAEDASGITSEAPVSADNGSASRAAGIITVKSEENRVPTFKAGEAKVWKLTIHNNSGDSLANVVIAPMMGDTNDEWPFKTEYQSYERTIEEIPAGGYAPVEFEFVQREDVTTDRKSVV